MLRDQRDVHARTPARGNVDAWCSTLAPGLSVSHRARGDRGELAKPRLAPALERDPPLVEPVHRRRDLRPRPRRRTASCRRRSSRRPARRSCRTGCHRSRRAGTPPRPRRGHTRDTASSGRPAHAGPPRRAACRRRSASATRGAGRRWSGRRSGCCRAAPRSRGRGSASMISRTRFRPFSPLCWPADLGRIVEQPDVRHRIGHDRLRAGPAPASRRTGRR